MIPAFAARPGAGRRGPAASGHARARHHFHDRQRVRRRDHAGRARALLLLQRPAFLHGDDLLQPSACQRALGAAAAGAVQRARPRFRSGLLARRPADGLHLRSADPAGRGQARLRHLVCRSPARRRLGRAPSLRCADQLGARMPHGEGGREEFASLAADGTLYFAGDPREGPRRHGDLPRRGCVDGHYEDAGAACPTSSMPEASSASR